MTVALATVMTNFIGLFGLTPLYPEVARDLHVTADIFGGFFLLQGAVSTLLQLPAGLLSDRFGRRPMLLIGIVFMVAGQLLRWEAADAWLFGLGQLCIGLSSPFAIAPSYALVADAHPGSGRTQAIGVLQASANVGMATGLVLAGFLSPLIGWRGYSLGVALLTLALTPLVKGLGARTDSRVLAPAGASGIARYLGNPQSRALSLAAVLVMTSWGGSLFLLPFVARSHNIGEVGGSLLLVPYLVGSFLGGIIAGWWSDRVGARWPAIVFSSGGVLALAMLGGIPFHPAVVVLSGLLIGATVSGAIALAASAVAESAMRARRGTGAALAVIRTGQGLGAAIAPAVAGYCLVHTGVRAAYLLLAVVTGVGGSLLAAQSPGQKRLYDSDLSEFK
jgi:MFS family permease